jgi:hypothetical protein
MSSNFTITLSLGSGAKGEELAARIKSWAGSTPVSEAIRNLIKEELGIKDIPYPIK